MVDAVELLTPNAQPNTTRWPEASWEDLLGYIEEENVIPIVGADLLQIQTDDGPAPLYSYIARRLEEKLGLAKAAGTTEPTLNDVVCRYLFAGGRREDVYPRVRTLMRDEIFAPPKALLQLAGIARFNLFVSVTFDTLLEDAINRARFGGNAQTESLAYAPNKPVDLPAAARSLARPVVYHLLGKLSTSPSFVLSDEDVLEFVHAMQSESHRPELLFDELENSHLLILGSGFPDWLGRFLLRTAKQRRLSDPRDMTEVVAEDRLGQDARFVEFLSHFSSRTRVFNGGGAAAFVAELARRWQERHGDSGQRPAGHAAAVVLTTAPVGEMPANAVFLSYAKEDYAAVCRLKAELEAAGIVVWFDKERLDAGDEFDLKIQRHIRECSFFVPIISRHTEARRRGFFRREWNYALDRALEVDPSDPFILPVAIDADIREAGALVPDAFRRLHWSRLPEGAATPEFVRRLQELLLRC
jgi:hypothetical protein